MYEDVAIVHVKTFHKCMWVRKKIWECYRCLWECFSGVCKSITNACERQFWLMSPTVPQNSLSCCPEKIHLGPLSKSVSNELTLLWPPEAETEFSPTEPMSSIIKIIIPELFSLSSLTKSTGQQRLNNFDKHSVQFYYRLLLWWSISPCI